MTRKRLFLLILTVVCILCGVYFRPLHLNTSGELQIVVTNFGVENGEPKLDTNTITDLTDEEMHAVSSILDRYTYYRTPATPFTDGSLDDLGDCVVHLYFLLDGGDRTYALTPTGELAVDGKTYRLRGAERCLLEIQETIGERFWNRA